jgi:hypothetical protein
MDLFLNDRNTLEYRQGYFVGLLFTISLGLGVFIERYFGQGLNVFGFLIVICFGYFLIPYFWDKFVIRKKGVN